MWCPPLLGLHRNSMCDITKTMSIDLWSALMNVAKPPENYAHSPISSKAIITHEWNQRETLSRYSDPEKLCGRRSSVHFNEHRTHRWSPSSPSDWYCVMLFCIHSSKAHMWDRHKAVLSHSNYQLHVFPPVRMKNHMTNLTWNFSHTLILTPSNSSNTHHPKAIYSKYYRTAVRSSRQDKHLKPPYGTKKRTAPVSPPPPLESTCRIPSGPGSRSFISASL